MFQIGEWVRWHSPTRKREITGQIHQFMPNGKVYIIARTWDGRGHHYYVQPGRLRKVEL